LKVVVRRLAPALTEAEFMKLIGEEWKVGAGRVDWFSYKPGKVSIEYAPYHQRCYVMKLPY
jgi:regulator of nonsense transcripts 3